MAVKFNFTLNDTDASNLISIIHDAKVAAIDTAQGHKVGNTKVDQMNANWYLAHAEYLEELKQKVLNGVARAED